MAKHMIYTFLIVNPSDVLQGTILKSSQKWLCFFLFLDWYFDPEIKCDNNFLSNKALPFVDDECSQTMIAYFQIEVESPGHCKINSRYSIL